MARICPTRKQVQRHRESQKWQLDGVNPTVDPQSVGERMAFASSASGCFEGDDGRRSWLLSSRVSRWH